NTFLFGLASDGDTLNERFAGVSARYENKHLGTDRVGLRFQFESYHEQWNQSTLNALAAQPNQTSDAYRTRQNFQPTATISLAKPLTLEIGVGFENFQNQYPAAHSESANALISTLRYHRRLEGSDNQHDLDAGYNLRAATRLLGSDFMYARHRWEFRYMLTRGKSVVIDDVTGGMISGRAPLFERFVLGNSSTLRGWNKYELDPLGGNRMAHNTVEYRYGVFQVFYDTGAIWDGGETAVLRHSVGMGLRQGAFSLAVAFPVRDGHIDPIFMVGMNY
ncbi:MAG TPA: BamA/TamA family outer membrane protein, partial [Bryobacteraceae bacterium]